MLLFRSCSFGIATTNTFIHSCSSLENYTRIQTKMSKVYTLFQTEMAPKPYRLSYILRLPNVLGAVLIALACPQCCLGLSPRVILQRVLPSLASVG